MLEASTNSVSIVRRLGAMGRPAKQLCADVLSGLSRQDRVNDRIDAEKLASYIGLNPSVCGSGEKEAKGEVSRFGRSDLKAIFVEAAQSAMRTDSPAARWAKRLLARGKEWNVAIAALARKLAVLCWHILMGHPAPSRERQYATAAKLGRLAFCVGKEAVRRAGFASATEFVAARCSMLYGHLPETVKGEGRLCSNA